MQTSFDRTNLVLLGVFTLFLVSSVSAAWNINVLDQPYSFQNVSNTSDTVQIIELTDGDSTPINESQLTGDSYVRFRYNGSVTDMEWLNNGYWYADFKLNSTGGEIEYEAEGETQSSLIGDSTSETNATRTFNLGNMSVNLMNDFSEPINPERTFDIQINVTDNNGAFEDQADVDFYFTNGTWTSEVYNINNMDDVNNDGQDDHYKNFGLKFDLKYASDYVLHINATNTSSTGYENPYGTQSMVVETLPEIVGEITRLNASTGCDVESFVTECERGTTIGTEFNITSAEAESVNLTLGLKDRDSGMWENQSTTRLNSDGDNLYTGEITVPDINTSKYERKFRLKYNASNGGREEIITREIDYNDFKLVDKSDAITTKGSYRVKLEIRKYFTPQLLTSDRIQSGQVTIDQPSGETLTSFSVDEMDRLPDSGHFKHRINIPLDSETGIYDMTAEVTNLYDVTKSSTFNFNVTEIKQTFTLNEGEEDFERTIDKTGNHTFNVTVENVIDSEVNLSTEISDELEDVVEVNDGENVTLDPEESRNVSIRFEIDSVDEHNGEIKFIDSNANYNNTIDVSIDRPACSYRTGSVCVLGSGLNVSSDERGEITKDFTVRNFGEKNESYDYTFDLSGNITDYASLGTDNTTLNTENDSETVNLTYDVSAPGFYSGTIEVDNEVDTVEIPVSLDSTVEVTSTSIGLPDSIDLGELQDGDSATADVEVENTGDIEITALEFSSEDYTVSADSVSISPGATETVSVEFSEVSSESGQLTVTAETSAESTTETVSVSATLVPDFGEQADEFERRLIDLDSQVSSESEQQTQLNNVQSSISDLRSAYRQGNYDRAETLSSQIQNTLDTVEMEVASSSNSDDPGQSGQDDEGGGIPILPIAAAIFVILLVGFVAYSSIELEPGDPLYNVLGQ